MKITAEMIAAGLAAKVRDYRAEKRDEEIVSVEEAMHTYGFHHPIDGGEMVQAILEAAFVAQPSPGGQGDARIPFETWAKDGGFDVSKFKGIYNSLETRAAWEAWLYWQRLAARQPVTIDDVPTAAMIEAAIGAFFKGQQWSSIRDRDAVDLMMREKMRETLQAALSAQPSPGGQGDARAIIEEFVQCATLGRPHGKLIAQAKDYLAARQPAGVDDATDRALGETIEQRDRCEEVADELADHIARITGVDIGEHSSGNCPWQNAIEAAEEYKPAQAVDLANVIDQIAQQWDGCSYDAVGETIDVGQAIRAAGKRLALIDKAVDK